jgi:hypothetical protein
LLHPSLGNKSGRTLKKEAAHSFEKLVPIYQNSRHHIPKDSNFMVTITGTSRLIGIVRRRNYHRNPLHSSFLEKTGASNGIQRDQNNRHAPKYQPEEGILHE